MTEYSVLQIELSLISATWGALGALLGWCSNGLGLSQQQCPPLGLRYKELGQRGRRRFVYGPSQGRVGVGNRPKELELQNGCFTLQKPLSCLRQEGLEPFLMLSLAGLHHSLLGRSQCSLEVPRSKEPLSAPYSVVRE